MNLDSILIVGAIIFSIGFYGVLTRRNAIAVLMCLELMFNAVNITAVAFSRYIVPANMQSGITAAGDESIKAILTGQVFAIMIITVAAAEVALGIAIAIALYRSRQTVMVTDANEMRN